jgi:nucleoside-diphosphate-sugar epimerase
MILARRISGVIWVAGLTCEAVKPRVYARRVDVSIPNRVRTVQGGDMTVDAAWSEALVGVRVIFHSAARAHAINSTATDPLAEFRRINVHWALNLARQAAAGVRRFVFISSIKVNGEFTKLGIPLSSDHLSAPLNPYGVSKMEAEQGLREIAAQTGMKSSSSALPWYMAPAPRPISQLSCGPCVVAGPRRWWRYTTGVAQWNWTTWWISS